MSILGEIKKVGKGFAAGHKALVKNPFSADAWEQNISGMHTGLDVSDKYRDGVVRPKETSKTPYGDMLGEINRQQQEYYTQQYRPVAQGLIADTKSTAIVDAATKEASVDNTSSINARRDRQKTRLGVTTGGAGAVLGDYNTKLNRTLQADGSINEARLQQDERNTALTNDLVGISRGIASDAMNGMTSASGNEAGRNSTNANIKAQNKAAQTQMAGSAAAMLLMMFM